MVWAIGTGFGRSDVPVVALAAGLSLLAVAPAPLGSGDRALYAVETSATPEMVDFAETLKQARAAAPAGTAVLVVGSALSIHQQLWAPLTAGGAFFYDDWLWFWQPHHAGAEGPTTDGLLPAPSTLTREYLEHHAIGAVAVTGAEMAVAAASPDLEHTYSGEFGVYQAYAVRSPLKIVSLPGARDTEVVVGRERLHARGTSTGGQATVRHNWYPRWRARVDGCAAAVSRTTDGYMKVAVPAGEIDLELSYGRDLVDWLSYAAAAFGCLVAGWMVFTGTRDDEARQMPRD